MLDKLGAGFLMLHFFLFSSGPYIQVLLFADFQFKL
jgi:hypothetical protein